MAFSATPQETLGQIDILLGIASNLEVLLDKNKLSETIQLVHGLSESEKAQAAEARAQISQYQSLIADLGKKRQVLDDFNQSLMGDKKKQEDDFAAQNASLDAKQEEIAASMGQIATLKRNLAEKETALNELNVTLDKQAKENAVTIQSIEVWKEKMRKAEADLATEKQAVANYDASLKARAAQLHELTEGM